MYISHFIFITYVKNNKYEKNQVIVVVQKWYVEV
jgi:hypothetical protein